MIVVFDLDDTLYPELSYVHSGFRAVAQAATTRFGGDPNQAYELLEESLRANGRGRQFDDLARSLGVPTRKAVRWMVRTYRHHEPAIVLPELADEVLRVCSSGPLYLVTDGHKVTQSNKVTALGLWERFGHCYLTNRYGVVHQKPSPHVFELILKRERESAPNAVYVGDNPHKDFRGVRPLGFRTIRVLQGSYRHAIVPPELDAECTISDLSELIPVLHQWGWRFEQNPVR
jgi:putative hydrolase of the HAD superfamily